MSRKYDKRWTPEYAAGLLAEAERSGLSERAFAKEKGVDSRRLSWWRKRLRETEVLAKKEGFVEVAVRQPATPVVHDRVEILLTNGRVVATAVDVDADALGRLLDAVEGCRC